MVPQFPLTQTVWLCYSGTGRVGIVSTNSWVLVVLWHFGVQDMERVCQNAVQVFVPCVCAGTDTGQATRVERNHPADERGQRVGSAPVSNLTADTQ